MDVSFFLKETTADGVLREFLTRDMQAARLSPTFRAYYRLRPFIPLGLRQRLQKGRKVKVDEDWYLPSEFMRALVREVEEHGEPLTVIHPWPGGASFAFVLTHDVETRAGLQNIERIAKLEESLGFRSSWNIIPYKYEIDTSLIRDLRSRGFEIGIHGYNHDGKLFWSRKTFEQRAVAINTAIHKYDAVGFRAPMVHRNLEWLQHLDIRYDASCFDIDPFQAMPGGVGSIWPFVCGKYVELPYTLPQDHTLFIALGERDCRIWQDKLDYIARKSGMALMLTHPDYLTSPDRLDLYRNFLAYVKGLGRECWHALPGDVAAWWRERDSSVVIADQQNATAIDGPAESRGVVAEVSVRDNDLSILPPRGTTNSAASPSE